MSESEKNSENDEKIEENHNENEVQKKKKARKFFAKEFRQKLSTRNAVESIKEFVKLCTHDQEQDYALEYLENGGNCLEIIRILDTLEIKNASNSVSILEALTILLLKIISSYPQEEINSEKACRELLNKHFSVLKSCLNLSSNSFQRIVVLKLFSSMITLTENLAKEILGQIFFDEANLQILTTPNNPVRTSFIHFLISFLIEGQKDTINLILQKQFLLQSVFPGLVYESPEIIQLFLSTLQANILENSEISKTEKMGVFNQKIIQNLISLYEWKGPQNYNPKKKPISNIDVDSEDKKIVCELVHQFLLILCTNKKFGVIFQNLSQTQNNLITNVVKSLNKPWNNPFLSDLVVKICNSCPDIFKIILQDIESSLEVRLSKNWVNTVQFLKLAIDGLNIHENEAITAKFNQKQLFETVKIYILPQNLLKIICNQILTHENFGIRYQGLLLLFTMLNALNKYLNVINKASNEVKEYLNNYLIKNLPPTTFILTNWDEIPKNIDSIIPIPNFAENLTLILDILYKYQTLCPDLVENITKELDINKFLETIESVESQSIEMQTKAISMFISCDAQFFHPSKALFSKYFPALLQKYFKNQNIKCGIEEILNKTEIFEGCQHEIDIFLYSILELENFDENLALFLTKTIQNVSQNFLKYNKELNLLQEQEKNTIFSIENWLKYENKTNKNIKLKNKTLGPLVVGLLNELLEDNSQILNINKILVHFLFSQTNPKIFVTLLLQEKYKLVINKYLLKYCKNFDDIASFEYLNKLLNPKSSFSVIFNHIFNDFELKNNFSDHQAILILNFVIFYYTRCISEQKLNINTQKKCLDIIKQLITSNSAVDCLNSIFNNPIIFQMFSPTNNNEKTIEYLCNLFIIEIIENLQTKTDPGIYLDHFRSKLVQEICVLLKKFNLDYKNDKLIEIIKIFGFNFDQSCEIINEISNLDYNSYKNVVLADIFVYIFSENYVDLNVFSDDVIKKIENNLTQLNRLEINSEKFENSLCLYIRKFPHINKHFTAKFFSSLILKPNPTKWTIKLACLLIKYNKKLIQNLERDLKQILDKRDLIFSILNVIKNYKNSNKVFEKAFIEFETLILKFVNKPQKVPNYMIENYEVVIKFVENYIKIENFANITTKIQKFETSEPYHTEVLFAIYNKAILSENNEENRLKLVTNSIFTLMNILNNILKRQNDENSCKINKIALDFNTYLIKIKKVYKIVYTDQNIYNSSVFQNFAKLCLKSGLQNAPVLLQLLNQVCTLTEGQNSNLEIIFEMAISHSESLNIILSNSDLKTPFLHIILTLCQKCPNVMTKQHIPVWLGGYTGCLQESDQYLLKLMKLYEKANIGFHEFGPFLWGSSAITHYSVKTGGYNNLWKQPKPKDVLNIFNEDKVFRTIRHFPNTRFLEMSEGVYSDSDLDVYDPAFYLPLLSHVLAPESTVRWHNITNKGILGLVIISLTSKDKNIRSAACHVLARFYHHLEGPLSGRQKFLWQHFIEFICRGVSALKNLSLSNPVAIFLCRCAFVFTRPEHILYKPLCNYLTAKECANFEYVPEVLELLFNSTVQFKSNREFILTVVRDGLRTDEDAKVVFKSMVIKFTMDLFNSITCDFASKKLILQIISSCVLLPLGFDTFITNCSLLSWLENVLKQICKNDIDLLPYFIAILNNLLQNILKEKFNKFKLLLIFISTIDTLKNCDIEIKQTASFVKNIYFLYEKCQKSLNKSHLNELILFSSKFVDCHTCNYYLKFGHEFSDQIVLKSEQNSDVLQYYLQLLTIKWIQVNKN